MNRILENYVKEVLYAYPLLKSVRKDYEDHIRNRAVLSYNSNMTAEKTAEYIAGEILEMRALEWLKGKVEEILERLDKTDRDLIAIRYFGKRKKLRDFLESSESAWSERKYFRRQAKAAEKVSAMFYGAGLTQERYLAEFVDMDIFRKIHRFVEEGKDKKISAEERRRMRG